MKPTLILAATAGFCAALPAMAQRDDAAQATGKALYIEKCGLCHMQGGFGTRVLSRRVPEGQALLEDRVNLPSSYTATVVRRGIGSMPQIREAELRDAELAQIASYLEKGR